MNFSAPAKAARQVYGAVTTRQPRAQVAEFFTPETDAAHKEMLLNLFGWGKGKLTDSYEPGLPPVPKGFDQWANGRWTDDHAGLVKRLESPEPLYVGAFFSL